MSYKGFAARIDYDDDDGVFFGRAVGISDGSGFHADSVSDLRKAFRDAVDDYLETCAKVGKTPQKPYSGNVMLRIDPELHARAALAAELAGKSLDQWGQDVLRRATENIG